MMEKRNLIILAGLLAAVIAVAFTVFAPMDKNIKLGFMGNKTSHSISAKFQYFNGMENGKLDLKEGEEISISYELNAVNGKLEINVLDANKKVMVTRKNIKGKIHLKAKKTQKYIIQVKGMKAKGAYSINWKNMSGR